MPFIFVFHSAAWFEARSADQAITNAIDRHVQAERADDMGDDGAAGALAPVG